MPSRPRQTISWITGSTRLFQRRPLRPGITFQNNYNLESGLDGAVLEISSPNINGGAFTDITDPAVGGSVYPGYNYRHQLRVPKPDCRANGLERKFGWLHPHSESFWGMHAFRLLK